MGADVSHLLYFVCNLKDCSFKDEHAWWFMEQQDFSSQSSKKNVIKVSFVDGSDMLVKVQCVPTHREWSLLVIIIHWLLREDMKLFHRCVHHKFDLGVRRVWWSLSPKPCLAYLCGREKRNSQENRAWYIYASADHDPDVLIVLLSIKSPVESDRHWNSSWPLHRCLMSWWEADGSTITATSPMTPLIAPLRKLPAPFYFIYFLFFYFLVRFFCDPQEERLIQCLYFAALTQSNNLWTHRSSLGYWTSPSRPLAWWEIRQECPLCLLRLAGAYLSFYGAEGSLLMLLWKPALTYLWHFQSDTSLLFTLFPPLIYFFLLPHLPFSQIPLSARSLYQVPLFFSPLIFLLYPHHFSLLS